MQTARDRLARLADADEVAQLRAERRGVAEVVVASHQLAPQHLRRGAANLLQAHWCDLAKPAGHRLLRPATFGQRNPGPSPARSAGAQRWKRNQTAVFKPAEKIQALASLQASILASPPEQLTNRRRQLRAAQPRKASSDIDDQLDILPAKVPTAMRDSRIRHNLCRLLHRAWS